MAIINKEQRLLEYNTGDVLPVTGMFYGTKAHNVDTKEDSYWDGTAWVVYAIGGDVDPVVMDVTYAELKDLKDTSTLVPGGLYKMTDFKTIYTQPISEVINTSTQGIADGLDTTVEPLILKAISADVLQKEVISVLHSTDTIWYDIDLDLTRGGAAHRGAIIYRKDNTHNLATEWDWRSIKFRRYATTADAWDSTVTYAKKDTVRIGDRIYMSVVADNLNNDPATTDNSKWMTLFYDLTSRPYLKYIHCKSNTDDMDTTWHMNVVESDYTDFYTFAFTTDLSNSSGVLDADIHYNNMSIINGRYVGDLKLYSNIVFINEEAEILKVSIEGALSNMTIRPYGDYMGDMEFRKMSYLEDSFLHGAMFKVKFSNVYALSNSFIRGLTYFTAIGNGILTSIATLIGTDANTGRLLNGQEGSYEYCLIYAAAWIHAGRFRLYYTDVIGGKLNNCESITLYHSTITAQVQSCQIGSSRGYYYVQNGDNSYITINAPLYNCLLNDIHNVTIDGNLNGVEGMNWKDVTIPANITLTDVVFDIVKWRGKNTWGTADVTITDKVVNRKYTDDDTNPTVEKLWYEETDENGTITYKELK
jgi:hypothetical protein